MAVTKLYMRNTYQSALKTAITAVGSDAHGSWVRLAETIFHPQGGGQRFDMGEINGVKVVNTQHAEGGEVNHYVEDATTLSVGDGVNASVDMERRAVNAALHTGGHFLAGLLENTFGLTAVQGHHYPGEARVEYVPNEGVTIDKEAVKNFLEENLAKIVAEGVGVRTLFDNDGNRSIQIADYRQTPCGGTHLSSIDQVAEIKIRNVRVQKGRLKVGYESLPNFGLFMSKVAEASSIATSTAGIGQALKSGDKANSDKVFDALTDFLDKSKYTDVVSRSKETQSKLEAIEKIQAGKFNEVDQEQFDAKDRGLLEEINAGYNDSLVEELRNYIEDFSLVYGPLYAEASKMTKDKGPASSTKDSGATTEYDDDPVGALCL